MWSQSCLLRTLGLDIDGSEILLFAWYTVEILWKHSGFSLKHIAIALFCWICLWIKSIPEKLLWVLIVQTWQPSLGPILPIFTGLSHRLCQCLARRAPIVQTVERFAGESKRLAVFINNEVVSWTGQGSLGMLRILLRKFQKRGQPVTLCFWTAQKGLQLFLWASGAPTTATAYSSYGASLTDEHWSPLLALFKTNGWQARPPWDVV